MSALALFPLLNRIDALIKKMNELLIAIGVPPDALPPIPQIVITMPLRSNRYHVFELDTATVRANVALGLKEMLKKQGVFHATYMVILALGGGFSYRVNDIAAPLVDAQIGAEWDEFEVEEVYITNTAAAAGQIAIIRVNWNPFLIRARVR